MNTSLRILVIGGSGHVGAAICRRLCSEGHTVAFTYCQNRQKALSLEHELKAQSYPLELGSFTQVKEVVDMAADQMGGLDGLVVASGLATAHQREGGAVVPKWDEICPSEFARMLTVNVMGVFFACQRAASIMASQRSGRIVLVGSIDGVKPVPSPVDYACCKAGLVGIVQSLAKDLGPHGILVNLIAPGILDGGIADLLSQELHEEYLKHCTLRRVGTAEEVAQWAAFLVGAKNTYLTGQTVVVDGGL